QRGARNDWQHEPLQQYVVPGHGPGERRKAVLSALRAKFRQRNPSMSGERQISAPQREAQVQGLCAAVKARCRKRATTRPTKRFPLKLARAPIRSRAGGE